MPRAPRLRVQKGLSDGGLSKELSGPTHGLRSRDHLLSIFDYDVDLRMRLGDEDGLGANATADVDERRSLGQRFPGESCTGC